MKVLLEASYGVFICPYKHQLYAELHLGLIPVYVEGQSKLEGTFSIDPLLPAWFPVSISNVTIHKYLAQNIYYLNNQTKLDIAYRDCSESSKQPQAFG